MAVIKAFRGYLYNSEKIDDLGMVMSPPYDSLPEEALTELYNQHEYNAIRIAKGKKFDTDTSEENAFTRAGDFLRQWIDDEILVRDSEPGIYIYDQEVKFNKTIYSNRGFVALLKLEDYGNKIIPCEDTTPVNKKDRFELLSRTKTNVNMISSMYIESEKFLSHMMSEITDTPPDVEFTTPDGAKERLWRICDKEKIEFIVNTLKNHTIYITDGQNRYETSLKYRDECIKNNPNHTGDEPYNYIMTLFTNAYYDGLVHIPYHRLIKFKNGFNEAFFTAACQDNFKIEKVIVDSDTSDFVDTIKKQIITTRSENRIALYCGGDYFYRLSLKEGVSLKDKLPGRSDAYLALDVTVLNNLILEDILNITKEQYAERVFYTKSVTEALELVQKGEYGCLLAINPVKTEQISSVALSGDKMPYRTLCVFPKPVTGVLFNIL